MTGPFKGAAGAGGMVVAAIATFCAAALMPSVFMGLGVIGQGGFIVGGVVLAGFAFPFVLPPLVPMAVVWGTLPSRVIVILRSSLRAWLPTA